MKRDVMIFVAGPISQGDLRANIRQACEAGVRLMKAGLAVHVPHLTCFMGQVYVGEGAIPEVLPAGTAIEDWYGLSLAEVHRCDAVLRLQGESRGADLEVAEAIRMGKPVFQCDEEVIQWAISKSVGEAGSPAISSERNH